MIQMHAWFISASTRRRIDYTLVSIERRQKSTVQLRCVVLRILNIQEFKCLCLDQDGWHGPCYSKLVTAT